MLRRVFNCSSKALSLFKNNMKITTFPSRPLLQHFSTNKINNNQSKEKMDQLKKQSKQFYNNHVEKIIQLKSSADFQAIITSSKEPMIIDLYADWCEPCKKLTPRLQKKVNSLQNVKLLKINIDKCAEIAHALQVKSVPTVYLIYQGQAIDKIQGNVGDQQFDKFFQNINKITGTSTEQKEAMIALETAKNFIGERKVLEAVQILQKFNEKKVSADLIAIKQLLITQCYLVLGKPSKFNDSIARAGKFEEFFKQAPQLQRFYFVLKQQIQKFQQQSKQDPQIQTLKNNITKASDKQTKLQAQYDLVNYYKSKQMTQNALQLAMQIIKQDKNWQDKKTNKLVLAIFKELGNNSPLVQKYRKIMQRILS